MIQASHVQVELNQEEIKKYIQQQLDQQLRHEYIFIDVEKLAKMMSVSRGWLEAEILNDPRVRVLERRKYRKKLYLYPEIIEAVRNISNEW